MRESKAELMDRLRREGRWDAFVRRREELKATGTDAASAWEIATAEIGPVAPAAETATAESDGPALAALARKPLISMSALLAWVFENLDTAVGPADAPSAGAWSMRQSVRTNAATRNQFYATFGPKMLAQSQADDEKKKVIALDREQGEALIAKTVEWINGIGIQPEEERRQGARTLILGELCPACREAAERRNGAASSDEVETAEVA